MEEHYQKAVDFHGHECPGLMIGFRAAFYAMDILELNFSEDEEVVCISENDACGVDAIQVVLGCSVGKGNLLFHLVGKQAFSFYNRQTNRSVRLILNPSEQEMTRPEKLNHYKYIAAEEMFSQTPTKIALPTKARLFNSQACEECGEMTAERWLRVQAGKKVCLDCFIPYTRLQID
ncbi:MAG: formylmethanofuran dehydrogenase [Clostridiaceae bacterium]|nr:formylmethanofuran dehydrogenase [Clostridiaceae bacterium]